MTQYLPSSGTIGLGMARSQWNDGGSPNAVTTISLGGTQCRNFAQKPSGEIKMSDLYSKYRGWKMQFFSYPATSEEYRAGYQYGGDSGSGYEPPESKGGSFVGVGSYTRQVINYIFPFHEFNTYTLNLGNITPSKFGNVTLLFIGTVREGTYTTNMKLGMVLRIDGLEAPNVYEYKTQYYGYLRGIRDNKYPKSACVYYKRNGGSISTINFTKVGNESTGRVMNVFAGKWKGLHKSLDRNHLPEDAWSADYAESVYTNGYYGNIGITCNDAGQPGGESVWSVAYYAPYQSFNVGDQIEIVDILYW